jgi:lipoic acid synthetase
LTIMTIAPEGRRLLRVEARNAETPIERKPDWIRTTASTAMAAPRPKDCSTRL